MQLQDISTHRTRGHRETNGFGSDVGDLGDGQHGSGNFGKGWPTRRVCYGITHMAHLATESVKCLLFSAAFVVSCLSFDYVTKLGWALCGSKRPLFSQVVCATYVPTVRLELLSFYHRCIVMGPAVITLLEICVIRNANHVFRYVKAT